MEELRIYFYIVSRWVNKENTCIHSYFTNTHDRITDNNCNLTYLDLIYETLATHQNYYRTCYITKISSCREDVIRCNVKYYKIIANVMC